VNIPQQEAEYLTRYLRENRITYADYLRGDHWQEIRLRRLSMPFCFCRVCGYSKGLQVHHNTYKRIGREQMTDLDLLCWKHHAETHEIIAATGCTIPHAVKALIERGRIERSATRVQQFKQIRKRAKRRAR
jgi:5-methylcytosine-specific restriction endonuclease McrA